MLRESRMEAQKFLHLATRYTFLEDVLYKKFYSKLHVDPHLRCLRPDEARSRKSMVATMRIIWEVAPLLIRS